MSSLNIAGCILVIIILISLILLLREKNKGDTRKRECDNRT